MKQQNGLFGADEAPIPPEYRGNLVAQAKAGAASPVQREFAKLLEAIERSAQRVQELELLLGEFRAKFGTGLPPLYAQQNLLFKDMVLFLHARLQQPETSKAKALTASHRKAISRMIVSLSLDLAQEGDAQMRGIHDLYSTSSLDDMDAEQILEMREMLAEMGVDLPGLDEQASLEQAAQAALEALAQKASQSQETEALRKAKRDQKRAEKAKANPKKQAALASKEQAAQDAQTALKTIYRQLARQLHPDRAISEAQRQDNHDLMSQVNVAYKKQDLLALLKLQLQASQIDASAINSVADEKLKTWVALLRRQAKELAEQEISLEMHMRSEFCVHPREEISRPTLDEAFQCAVQDVEIDIQAIQEDLALVQNDAGLKRWAKEQSRALQDEEDMNRQMTELASQLMREREVFFTNRPNQNSAKKQR